MIPETSPLQASSATADETSRSLDRTIERVTSRIAPTWPLDRFIAVNPLWGFVDEPFPTVASHLAALSGADLLMQRAFYREAWRSGTLTRAHLEQALGRTRTRHSLSEVERSLDLPEPTVPRRATVVDVADTRRDLDHQVSFRDFVTNQISQLCASYFDEDQATLQPVRRGGLYRTWRRQALSDRSPRLLMGFRTYRERVAELPRSSRELFAFALDALEVPVAEREAYLTALLLGSNGWAAYCAYLRWTARLADRDDAHIVDLLAIRLAWEWLLFREGGTELRTDWRAARARWSSVDHAASNARAVDWTLQRALELAYQDEIASGLAAAPRDADERTARRAPVQAAFCIDVRSEVIRRALEAEDGAIQTLGFAGFFGAPIEYQPAGAADARPQLPGLLAPRLRVTDTAVPSRAVEQRAERLAGDETWRAFRTGATSTFSFVESLGLLYLGKLFLDVGRRARAIAPERAGLPASADRARRPRLVGLAGGGELDMTSRVDLAAGILRAMSLTRDAARIVLLVGHGSESVNNAHAAGLDCGACCGHTGEVNARAVAALLNEPEVRRGLGARGFELPEDTRFVAALHNTTTDAIDLFDLEDLDDAHRADVERLVPVLERAADRARAERAPALGLGGLSRESLREAVAARARDWSNVRPEWGLAGNAAFVVAPRRRSRHLDLRGRAFLHDYRWEDDRDFSVLELVMTAPMVVTHWINLQYYASTVDNARYGSGNKVLHNVVGGHLGVFEGNGGDLRIGLPLQSLHDGERWVHTPLRLSVFIEAPREGIEGVLAKHERVRQLVDNEWLFLFQIDPLDGSVHAREHGTWRRVSPPSAPEA